jgi:predicted Zn-dependent protease
VRSVCWSLAIALAAAPVGASSIPVAEERKIGAEIVVEARRHLPMIDDYEIQTYIQKIGYKLVATLGTQPFDYEFFVVNDGSLNAFAVPGGKIFVHAGLISAADNMEEVAGVMGHEVAHAAAHHSVRQQQKGQAASVASIMGLFLTILNPVVGIAAMSAGMSQQLAYQRDFEREADFLGIEYTKEAGYEPGAMLGLLRKIYDEQKLNPTAVPPYLLSHPMTGERLAYLESALGRNEWQVNVKPVTFEFERVQAIARANSKTRETAVPYYERRLAKASAADKPAALELIGILMVHGDDYTLGVEYLTQAEKAGRKVDRELGRAYLRRGNLEEAESRLLRAAKANSKDWNAQADLGSLYFQQGRFEDSVAAYKNSVELYPWPSEPKRQLARSLDKAGRTGEAFYYYGVAAEYDGASEPALGYLKKAQDQLPPDSPLREDLAKRIEALEKATSGPPAPPVIRREPGR